MTSHRQWIVTAAPGRPLDEIAKELSDAGLAVEQVLDAIGSITGRGSADLAPSLRAVRGVADVAPGQDLDVGPPGADSTW